MVAAALQAPSWNERKPGRAPGFFSAAPSWQGREGSWGLGHVERRPFWIDAGRKITYYM